MAKPKIIFFGTPVFGQIVLQHLLNEKFNVVGVVTQPDRPVGREKRLTPTPVKVLAKENKIKVFTPESKKELLKLSSKLASFKPDLFVVASYGLIIPQEILDIPAKGALNIHPSLLPQYRGASPIQTALLRGDAETGVTIMLMDAAMDHGPVVDQQTLAVAAEDNTPTLSEKLARTGAELLARTIPAYMDGKITPQPQDHTKATYTKIIDKNDGKINWGSSNDVIERMLRAYYPWPGVWTTVGEMTEQLEREIKNPKAAPLKLKILAAHLENSTLVMDILQVEGKKPITFADFIKGYLASTPATEPQRK